MKLKSVATCDCTLQILTVFLLSDNMTTIHKCMVLKVHPCYYFLFLYRDIRVVARFIGATGESRDIRLLLQSLCYQIADIYDLPTCFSEVISTHLYPAVSFVVDFSSFNIL